MTGDLMERWLESFANAIFLRSSDTAHDLKTPLNIAVLNLELLRMRVRKLTGAADDEKLIEYAGAIETELRRMARIFDTYFIFCTPPRDGEPQDFDAAPLIADLADDAGCDRVEMAPAILRAHEARITQALKLFFDGASRLITGQSRRLEVSLDGHQLCLTLAGNVEGELEPSKLFKFYYTDASGNPDVSLAAARLIVETYGGELNAVGEGDKVSLHLTLPLGEE